MEKMCKKCDKTKPLIEMAKAKNMKDGYLYLCKDCKNIKNLQYKLENKDSYKIMYDKYFINNRDTVRINRNKYRTKARKENQIIRITENIRSLINSGFKRKNYKKNTKTQDILGITFKEFKEYLESKFENWMNWENYGKYNGTEKYGWDIDHIMPISKANNENEIIRLNNYTNLQPLCSFINRDIKRDCYEG